VRAALLVLFAACHHDAPPPAAPAPPAQQGCPTVAACTAEADDALGKNDIPRALNALNRACVFGDAHSCAREGVYLTTNPQQDGDAQRAQVLFSQACDNNDGLGCEQLAMKADDAKAAQLYDKSCSLGDQNSCGKLAFRLHAGKGTSVDNARAVQLAQQSCQAGAGIGCAALGRAFAEGWNGTVDKDQAKTLFTKSCDLNDGHGCADLADVTTNPTEAARLRAKACAQGYHEACTQ
jgi:TPR repeat protein